MYVYCNIYYYCIYLAWSTSFDQIKDPEWQKGFSHAHLATCGEWRSGESLAFCTPYVRPWLWWMEPFIPSSNLLF